jgi:hypothetical protein
LNWYKIATLNYKIYFVGFKKFDYSAIEISFLTVLQGYAREKWFIYSSGIIADFGAG